MKTGYKVMDAMTTKPIAVDQNTTLLDCARTMDEKHVGAVVVKDNEHSLGIITEQDIVRKVVAKGINPLTEKVKDYMEKKLITVSPEKDIYDALILMRDNNIRHLPVTENNKMVGLLTIKNIRHLPVTENNKMVGLLTIKDVLKIEPQLFELVVEKFELRESSRKPISRIIPEEGLCEACGEYTEKIKDVDGSLLCESCAEEQA